MWVSQQADGFNPPFRRKEDLSMFTAIFFDLTKTLEESVAGLAGIDILNIAYKEAGREGGRRK